MLRTCATRLLAIGLLTTIASGTSSSTLHAKEGESEHVLFQAVRRGDVGLLKDVLRRGTPPDIHAADGSTPLIHAALHGTAEMVSVLLEHGADARAANERGVTALLWGARDAEKVRLLLAGGADPNAVSALGNTPLLAAAASPSGAASVEQLLSAGADMRLRNKSGRSALNLACTGGDVKTVRLLLARAQELNQLDIVVREAGATVAFAATDGFHEIVKLLLEHGADPNRSNGSRGHGLNAALLAGKNDIARTIVMHGTDLDCRTNPGDVPTAVLAAYTEVGDSSMVELLKARGVDFSRANEERQTALTWARMRGDQRLVDSLLKAGATEGELPPKQEIAARKINFHAGNQPRLIVEAVRKSLDLLQLSSDEFLNVRGNCVSCHHQNLPSVAIAWARDRGFQVRQSTLDRMTQRQVDSWQPRIDRAYELDVPFPVPPTFLGYGMWTFAELGYQPDELTRAISWYLAAIQQPDGRWVPGMLRPPLGGDGIQATALAMRSLQLYPLEGRDQETAQRVDRAHHWLEEAKPLTHEEEIYRMLGLGWGGTEPKSLADEVQSLLNRQRDDGGWAQLPGLDSDAWATGQALVALHTAGGLSVVHPAYRRGVEWLLSTQFGDGSWYVQSRSWPFQPYFESKFPYGRDQWISAPATAWAVMALVNAVEPADVAKLKGASVDSVSTRQTRITPLPQSAQTLVAATARTVDFEADIRPLLVRSCLGCHGDKEPEANFSVNSRASLLQGGDSELPAIIPGDSKQSPLVQFSASLVPKMEMPPLESRDKHPPLTSGEIALLRAWIDQGAIWAADSATSIAK